MSTWADFSAVSERILSSTGEHMRVRDVEPEFLTELYSASIAWVQSTNAARSAVGAQFQNWFERNMVLTSPPMVRPDVQVLGRQRGFCAWFIRSAERPTVIFAAPVAGTTYAAMELRPDARLREVRHFVAAIRPRWTIASTKIEWEARVRADVARAFRIGGATLS